jgi:hypothetical protein
MNRRNINKQWSARNDVWCIFKIGRLCSTFVVFSYGKYVLEFEDDTLEQYGIHGKDIFEPETLEWRPLDDPKAGRFRITKESIVFELSNGKSYWLHRTDLRSWAHQGKFPRLRDYAPGG